MKMSFNVSYNLDEGKMKDAAREVLYQAMHEMHDEASILCPVDTGRLKNSIHLDPIGKADTIILADGVDYGVHQEFGTVNMPPSPFFRPSLDRIRQRLPQIWKEVLSRT